MYVNIINLNTMLAKGSQKRFSVIEVLPCGIENDSSVPLRFHGGMNAFQLVHHPMNRLGFGVEFVG
jgi:hypothetical protein